MTLGVSIIGQIVLQYEAHEPQSSFLRNWKKSCEGVNDAFKMRGKEPVFPLESWDPDNPALWGLVVPEG